MVTTGPRVIGMLGGMSWESSALYYRLANELVRERLGGLHSARGLQTAGAELLVLCTNTMHKVADQVEAAVDIPFLHLIDVTATAISRSRLKTVGLLGTAFTMEQDFYRDRLAGHGPTVLVPPAQDRAEVHRVIYDELCRGEVLETSRQIYRDVILRLVDAGAQGIILGCTEVELLVDQADSPVPVFATTRLHVEAAVDASLAGRTAS